MENKTGDQDGMFMDKSGDNLYFYYFLLVALK